MTQQAITAKKNKQMLKFNPTLVLVGITAIVVFISICYWGANVAKKYFLSSLVTVNPVNIGAIRDTAHLHGYIIRDEIVVNAPVNGKLIEAVEEGERVRLGSTVVKLETSDLNTGSKTVGLTAPISGIISYEIDSKEHLTLIDNIEKVDLTKLLNSLRQKNKQSLEVSNNKVQGQGVFKVIDNLTPTYLLTEIPDQVVKSGNFEEQEIVYAKVFNSDQYTSFRIVRLVPNGSIYQALLSTSTFLPATSSKRELDFEFAVKKYVGYIIPTDALVTRDGQKGIYIVYKQSVHFEFVEVKGIVGQKAAVIAKPTKDKVSRLAGANVLLVENPSLVSDGQQLQL